MPDKMACEQELALADVVVSSRGAKVCPVHFADDRLKQAYYNHPNFITAPFGPSCFDTSSGEAPRQNLEFRCDDVMFKYFSGIDTWAIDYIANNSERLLKKSLTPEQVKERYHPLVRQKGGYDPLLKCKICMPGLSPTPCRVWDTDAKPTALPTNWRTAQLRPRIHISHMWIMGTDIGLVCLVTDLLVREESHAFPFDEDEPML